MAMKIEYHHTDNILIIKMKGRLDAGAVQFVQESIDQQINNGADWLVLNLQEVDYLSSAGIRVLLTVYKRLKSINGQMKLCHIQSYPMNIFEISGFLRLFEIYPDEASALADFQKIQAGQSDFGKWDAEFRTTKGLYRFYQNSLEPTQLRVTGSNQDFLLARCTLDSLVTENLANVKYSLGIGMLGERSEESCNRMGELMIIGGTVVWVPTDGQNIPDFLIPADMSIKVPVHTAYHIVLDDVFNDYIRFESADANEQISLGELYRDLFDLAGKRINGFKGLLAIVLRADMGSIFGAGIKKAPIPANAPLNGRPITDPSNIREWLNFQVEGEYENSTALMVGIGLDRENSFKPPEVQSLFPVDERKVPQYLHNHAAIFDFLPESKPGFPIEREINSVLRNANFIGMEHLLERSSFKKGLIGISYIQTVKI
jgi:anti-anti-sigma factor